MLTSFAEHRDLPEDYTTSVDDLLGLMPTDSMLDNPQLGFLGDTKPFQQDQQGNPVLPFDFGDGATGGVGR